MIITRTPFRISFFGGGTDYPVWYRENGGAVLATTINKYCYITVRNLPPFFEYKNRIVWSKIENVKEVDEIEHPSVRTCLKYLNISQGIVVHHDADLPARTGLGSSSAFTVGLLHALCGLKGLISDKKKLAEDAICIEQNLLKENVGCQDQIIAAHGGLNHIRFSGEDKFFVTPITLPKERLELLQDHLMLFFTGISRSASEIAAEQVRRTKEKILELSTMYQMVEEGLAILKGAKKLEDFGQLIHENWKLKKSLTNKISNSFIDDLYEEACRAGAIGGKLLGAGGGGFFLIFARPENQSKIKQRLSKLLHVPFRFENFGSQIIFYEPDGLHV